MLLSVGILTALLPACGSGEADEDPGKVKVLVLGMDGLDPQLLEQLMSEDRLPNFSRLAAVGSYSPFGTSMPPQSPVAWSNFISGAQPGTHQIFDWIHRKPNPETAMPIMPYLSTSEALPPENPDRALDFGKWRIPLESGREWRIGGMGKPSGNTWLKKVSRPRSTACRRIILRRKPPARCEFKVLSRDGGRPTCWAPKASSYVFARTWAWPTIRSPVVVLSG